MNMNNHNSKYLQQTIEKSLDRMMQCVVELEANCLSKQISYALALWNEEQDTKLQELLREHRSFDCEVFFLLALARHSYASGRLIPVFISLLQSRISSLIQSFALIPTEKVWLYDSISRMVAVMAFLCPLLPNSRDKEYLICRIIWLHESATSNCINSALRPLTILIGHCHPN